MRWLLPWILIAASVHQAPCQGPITITTAPPLLTMTETYNRTQYWPVQSRSARRATRLTPATITRACTATTALTSLDMVGTGCEHDGVIYRNGQSFLPSCKYRCLCVNGAIGCVTLCSDSQPPLVWCQAPRRVKLPGRCCEQWICDEARRTRKASPRHALDVFPDDNEVWQKNCVAQTTSWSPCSKTCGRGLSTRISNTNDQCEMVKESRLCTIRPCEVDITKHIKPGKKCLNIYREEQPQNFTLSGCTSTKAYRPKFCGVCTDERCCIPYKSRTVEVEFRCPNGAVFSWQHMWINACFCNLSCKNPNDIFDELERYYDYPEVVN